MNADEKKIRFLEAELDLYRRCLGRLWLSIPKGTELTIDDDTEEQAILASEVITAVDPLARKREDDK